MLSIQNLTAVLSSSFRLEGVGFELQVDERVAVLGPNGSGKSYLLRLILGLETPDEGRICWGDEVLSRGGRVVVPPEARGMGVVFQEGALFPHLDVRRNVALGLPRGTDRRARAEKVDRALDLARIRHLHDRPVQALSGGEQQRVAIARALARRPRVLLLDEPFHSLDGPLKREVLGDLRDLVADEGIATLFVTHDTDEAAAFAERIVMLRAGRMIRDGTFDELYTSPPDRAAAEFLGPVEELAVEVAREAGIALPEDHDAATLTFRREHVALLDSEAGGTGRLEVVDVRGHGAFRDVTLRLPGGETLISRVTADRILSPGQRVGARITRAFSWPPAEERRA